MCGHSVREMLPWKGGCDRPSPSPRSRPIGQKMSTCNRTPNMGPVMVRSAPPGQTQKGIYWWAWAMGRNMLTASKANLAAHVPDTRGTLRLAPIGLLSPDWNISLGLPTGWFLREGKHKWAVARACCAEAWTLTKGIGKITGRQTHNQGEGGASTLMERCHGNPQLGAKELLPLVSQVYPRVFPKGKRRNGVIGLETPGEKGFFLSSAN